MDTLPPSSNNHEKFCLKAVQWIVGVLLSLNKLVNRNSQSITLIFILTQYNSVMLKLYHPWSWAHSDPANLLFVYRVHHRSSLVTELRLKLTIKWQTLLDSGTQSQKHCCHCQWRTISRARGSNAEGIFRCRWENDRDSKAMMSLDNEFQTGEAGNNQRYYTWWCWYRWSVIIVNSTVLWWRKFHHHKSKFLLHWWNVHLILLDQRKFCQFRAHKMLNPTLTLSLTLYRNDCRQFVSNDFPPLICAV